MEITVPHLLMWIVGQLVVAAGIWGGIRADLRNMRQHLSSVSEATKAAHARIDRHLESPGLPNRRTR